ncbi:hypothetical protein SNE40_000885 [Patella caerulea]|uniref:Apple domain-containing protein n=1 Tax=Patella caerulea TaxID=87958 RepID=A0AAN8KHH1_PATCE
MEEYIYHNRDKEVFKDYTWIYVGITDKQTEGTWLAIGDKKVSWLNFAGDQPDGGTQENCLFMQLDKTGYKLRDINCVNYDIHGLCGKKIIVSPNVFTAKRGKLNNHVFRSFQAYSVSHCTLNCFQTDSCQSCNYDKTTHTCQLNGMTREMASLADFSNFGGLYLSFKTKEESI